MFNNSPTIQCYGVRLLECCRPRPLDGPVKARTSRVDAPIKSGPVARPSSLPYRPQRAPDNHRRAVSSSTVRQPSNQPSPPHK